MGTQEFNTQNKEDWGSWRGSQKDYLSNRSENEYDYKKDLERAKEEKDYDMSEFKNLVDPENTGSATTKWIEIPSIGEMIAGLSGSDKILNTIDKVINTINDAIELIGMIEKIIEIFMSFVMNFVNAYIIMMEIILRRIKKYLNKLLDSLLYPDFLGSGAYMTQYILEEFNNLRPNVVAHSELLKEAVTEWPGHPSVQDTMCGMVYIPYNAFGLSKVADLYDGTINIVDMTEDSVNDLIENTDSIAASVGTLIEGYSSLGNIFGKNKKTGRQSSCPIRRNNQILTVVTENHYLRRVASEVGVTADEISKIRKSTKSDTEAFRTAIKEQGAKFKLWMIGEKEKINGEIEAAIEKVFSKSIAAAQINSDTFSKSRKTSKPDRNHITNLEATYHSESDAVHLNMWGKNNNNFIIYNITVTSDSGRELIYYNPKILLWDIYGTGSVKENISNLIKGYKYVSSLDKTTLSLLGLISKTGGYREDYRLFISDKAETALNSNDLSDSAVRFFQQEIIKHNIGEVFAPRPKSDGMDVPYMFNMESQSEMWLYGASSGYYPVDEWMDTNRNPRTPISSYLKADKSLTFKNLASSDEKDLIITIQTVSGNIVLPPDRFMNPLISMSEADLSSLEGGNLTWLEGETEVKEIFQSTVKVKKGLPSANTTNKWWGASSPSVNMEKLLEYLLGPEAVELINDSREFVNTLIDNLVGTLEVGELFGDGIMGLGADIQQLLDLINSEILQKLIDLIRMLLYTKLPAVYLAVWRGGSDEIPQYIIQGLRQKEILQSTIGGVIVFLDNKTLPYILDIIKNYTDLKETLQEARDEFETEDKEDDIDFSIVTPAPIKNRVTPQYKEAMDIPDLPDITNPEDIKITVDKEEDGGEEKLPVRLIEIDITQAISMLSRGDVSSFSRTANDIQFTIPNLKL